MNKTEELRYPLLWDDRVQKPAGKMEDRIVTQESGNLPKSSTRARVAVIALAYLLCMTVVGIPLAFYLVLKNKDEPKTTPVVREEVEMDGMGFAMVEDDGPSTEEIMSMESSQRDRQLESGNQLGDKVVIEYATKLKEKLGFELIPDVLRTGLISSSESVIETIKDVLSRCKGKPVFIPFILDGGFIGRDHIVLISINQQNKVEYFDSQGKALESESRCINGLRMKPHEFVQKLGLEVAGSNKTKYQTDWVSCGVYVLKFMEARAQGSFAEACAEMTFYPGMAREEIAEELSKNQHVLDI